MRGKWFALLALPFVLVVAWTRYRVAHWGDDVARDLGSLASLVPSSTPLEPEGGDAGPAEGAGSRAAVIELPDAGVDAAGARTIATTGAALDAGASSKSPVSAPDASRAHGGRLSVVVPVDAVARAMDAAGDTMHARTTRDAEGHPVGVKLTGVSPAHIGLEDGDVIVSVDGKPTKDDDRATELALAVLGRGDATLHAVVMRGDTPIDVTLDLPTADAGKAR